MAFYSALVGAIHFRIYGNTGKLTDYAKSSVSTMNSRTLWLVCTSYLLGLPLVEEIAFRRIFPFFLELIFNNDIIIRLICSILFGLMHLFNASIVQIHDVIRWNQVVTSMFLGWIVSNPNNTLLTCYLLHLFYNVLICILLVTLKYVMKRSEGYRVSI